MSTIRDLTARLPDEDEEDPDFVPLPDEEPVSCPETEPELPLIEGHVLPAHDVPEEKRRQRAELWAKFLAMDPPRPSGDPPRELVKVVKTYKFAGKEMEEIVEVAEDSTEAAKWPRYEEPSPVSEGALTAQEVIDVPMADLTRSMDATPSQSYPIHKRPGPRRGKVTLPGFTMGHRVARTPYASPTAITTSRSTSATFRNRPSMSNPTTTSPATLTTLDKSALDWQSHVGAQERPLRDELAAHRRGGGYLEKVAFMQRVEQRREVLLEAGRGGKRTRRGG